MERKLRAREKIISDLRETVARLSRDGRTTAEMLSEVPVPKNTESHYKQVISQLQNEVEERVGQLTDIEDSLRDVQSENRLLGRLVDDLRAEREGLLERVSQEAEDTEFRKALESTTAENAALQRKLQQKHEYCSRLEARLKLMEQENKTLRDALEIGGGEAIAAAEISEKVEAEKSARLAAEDKCKDLRSELRTLRLEHDRLQHGSSNRDDRVADLTNQIAALHDRLGEASTKQYATKTEIQSLRGERVGLEERIVELQDDLTIVSEQASTMSVTNSRVNGELRIAQERIYSLEKSLDEAKMTLRLEKSRIIARRQGKLQLEPSDYELLEKLRYGVQQLRDELVAEYESSEVMRQRMDAAEKIAVFHRDAATEATERATSCTQALSRQVKRINALEKLRISDLMCIDRLTAKCE